MQVLLIAPQVSLKILNRKSNDLCQCLLISRLQKYEIGGADAVESVGFEFWCVLTLHI